MRYRLLKGIGYLYKDMRYNTDDQFIRLDVKPLIEQGYIEEIQEPWATDKDLIEFGNYYRDHYTDDQITGLLQQFKKERGKK